MYRSCALATASCDCTTSTVSVTPALKRSRDSVSVSSAKSMLLRATLTCSADDCRFSSADVGHGRLVIGTRSVSAFQSLVNGDALERLVRRLVREFEFLPRSQADH